MKFSQFILLAALPFAFASCDDPAGPVETFEDKYTANFTYVQNVQTGESALLQGAEYNMYFDFTAETLKVGVKNLFFQEGSSARAISFELPAARFSFDQNGAWSMKRTEPYLFASNGGQHTVSDFSFSYLSRIYGQSNFQVYDVSYLVDDCFRVRALQNDMLYFAATKVTMGQQTTFQSANPYYAVVYDPSTQTAKLYLYGAQFAAQQPPMDMVFPGIPFTVSPTDIVLDCEELTPTIDNVPYPQYAISNLKATLAPGGTGLLEFDCSAGTHGKYHVAVDLYLHRK